MERKGVKLISTLIAVLISAILLLSCILIFIAFLNNGNKNTIALNGSGSISDPYTISSQSDLYSFQSAVANGNDFVGKYLSLTKDLDFSFREHGQLKKQTMRSIGDNGDTYCCSFRGVFNGNGFAISGLNIISTIGALNRDYIMVQGCGLFSVLSDGAVIQNLKMSNCTIQVVNGYADSYIYIGSIAGVCVGNGNVIISNCSVENCSIIKNTGITDYHKYIGAIVGGKVWRSSIQITNCYVDNFTVSLSGENYYNGYTVAKIGPAFNAVYASSKVENCVVKNVSINTAQSATIYNFAGDGVTVSNCYDSKNGNFENLNKSNVGGNYQQKATYWYHNENYNDGYPKLRSFLIWQSVIVRSEDSNKGVLVYDGQTNLTHTLYFPSGETITRSYDSNKMMIYGCLIEATANNMYEFARWENDVAYFKMKECNVVFNVINQKVNGKDIKINPIRNGTHSSSIGYQCKIEYGTVISLTQDTVTGTDNKKRIRIKYSWNNNGTEIFISFTTDPMYQFEDMIIEQTYTVTGDMGITPTIKLKSYTVQFK